MTEKRQLSLPEVRFGGSYGSADAAKHVIDLWSLLPPWYAPLPDELKVIGFQAWRQAPGDVPADMFAHVPWMVDGRGLYSEEANFPATENSLPRVARFLGAAHIQPNEPVCPPVVRHDPPIVIRKGDLIVCAPNLVAGNAETAVFGNLMLEGEGDWPLDPGLVYFSPMNYGCAGTVAVSGRVLIPNIPVGGTKLNIGFGVRQFGGAISAAAVGVASGSGPDMVSEPVPLSFGGAPGFSLPPAEISGPGKLSRIDADELSFPTTAGMSLIVDFQFTGGPWSSNKRGGTSWHSMQNTHATAAMAGAMLQNEGYCVDCVRVR